MKIDKYANMQAMVWTSSIVTISHISGNNNQRHSISLTLGMKFHCSKVSIDKSPSIGYSFWHGLRALTTVPKSTQPSILPRWGKIYDRARKILDT